MKYLIPIIFTAILVLVSFFTFAQSINWKNLDASQRHIVNLNAGYDHASVIGAGYGYHLKTAMPVILNVDYSMPFGNNFFDDFKTKIGGQVNVLHANHFYAAVNAYGVFRRYENDLSRMLNFGSEFSGTAGYYKTKWYAAAAFGFDKAIVTHIKHSDLMKDYNPGLESGWYIPTGGYFFYGIQGGYSFKRNELYAKIGQTVEQDFKTHSMVPYYFQLGWNVKW